MAPGVRVADGRPGRPGKSPGPERGDTGGLTPPPVASGDDADEIIEESQRSSTSRRELATNPTFDDISPELGELDEAALDEAFDVDPDDALALLAEMTQVEAAGVALDNLWLSDRAHVVLEEHRLLDGAGSWNTPR